MVPDPSTVIDAPDTGVVSAPPPGLRIVIVAEDGTT